MAKIKDIIARVDECAHNAFSDETKLRWVAELEGRIAADVFLLNIGEIREMRHPYPEGLEHETLVDFPHDGLYELYLECRIHAANGETNRYQNILSLYNASYENFVRWFVRTYDPAQGHGGM